ncbi:phage tail protein [Niveispirillum sp. SYP-B3756]|uniref:phage tail protein n=1 Tax=Niveispirillum sp. SYP-B3756 TaxID=2662178 RepID=UPI00129245C5|nr:phage tail protein [Niveispirillum sp. SYP-B3756]MQP66370.1 phage tail protein [Niveispirillum sp. SYP-B3756]
MNDTYYPVPGFRFTVVVAGTGTPLQLASRADTSFEEVSGLDAQIETEPLKEGGENRFVYQLPSQTKSPNLVLKRGYVTAPSFLSEWAAQTVGSSLSLPILTQSLVVMLLGENGWPLVAWNVANAWPVRWVTGPLNAQENKVLTEILEFSCTYITRVPLNEQLVMVPAVAGLIRTQ